MDVRILISHSFCLTACLSAVRFGVHWICEIFVAKTIFYCTVIFFNPSLLSFLSMGVCKIPNKVHSFCFKGKHCRLAGMPDLSSCECTNNSICLQTSLVLDI